MKFSHTAHIGALLCACPLAACSIIPTPPDALPEDWVPSISPSPLDPGLVDSPLGFGPEEESAVRIRATTCEGVSTGSGFILDAHTIVTNRHVVDGYLTLDVTTADGRDLTVDSASTSLVADIGVLTTVEALEPAAPLADEDPSLADLVTVVGYPEGEELTTTFGTILNRSSDTLDNADHVFTISATVKHGSSGSAAYDKDGQVFGVVYAGQDETGYGYIIPMSIVQDALDHLDSLGATPACQY